MKKFAISAFIAVPMLFLAACGIAEQDSESSSQSWSAPIVRAAAGADAASIQWAVDAYRADLGGANNLNAVGTQAAGHREINWDGVPADKSSPNNFPGDFFKTRGLLIKVPGDRPQVSTKKDEANQAAPLFANLNWNFANLFSTFSPEKLFSPVSTPVTELTFTVPGSDKKATVSGFGAVFTDVDLVNVSKIEYYDLKGAKIHSQWVPNVPGKHKGLSFAGATFKGQQIARVLIYSGNIALASHKAEDKWNDAVALDDFLYAEPKAVAQR